MSWLHGLAHRVRKRLSAGRHAREREEEERLHREMMGGAGGQAGGPPPGRAARRADVPHPDQRPERVPRWGGIAALRDSLVHASRTLLRAPRFAALVALTIALGAGANGAVFALVDRVFLSPPAGLEAPDELRRLYGWLPPRSNRPTPMEVPEFPTDAYGHIRDVLGPYAPPAAWTAPEPRAIGIGDRHTEARLSWVSHDYFSVLGVDAREGRVFGPEEASLDAAPHVAVLSHRFRRRAFAPDEPVLGSVLELGGRSFTVVGVAASGFEGMELGGTDVFLPTGTLTPYQQSRGPIHRVALRLEDGFPAASAEELATAGFRRWQGTRDPRSADPTASAFTVQVIAAHGPEVADTAQPIAVSKRLGGVAALLLLITCANVACLLLVRAARRRQEMALRLALGISRRRLAAQLLAEGLLLALAGGVGAMVLASLGGEALGRLLFGIDWARPALDLRGLLFTLGASLAVGLLAGLAPAGQAGWLTGGPAHRGGRRVRTPLRSGLLVAQATLSVVLLVGAGLFAKSLVNLSRYVDYDVDEIGWVRFARFDEDAQPIRPTPDQHLAFQGMRDWLEAHPEVRGTAFANMPPLTGYSAGFAILPDGDSLREHSQASRYFYVSPSFFALTGRRIVAGRAFAEGEPHAVVMNETAARLYWPSGDPLGRCVRINDAASPCSPVVGIVADAPATGLRERETLQFYVPLSTLRNPSTLVVRLDRGSWTSLAPALVAESEARVGPGLVEVEHLSDYVAWQLRPWRVGARLFSALGVLALLVTGVGVYGVTAYALGQRTQEMGVRVALGAQVPDVVRLALRDGLRVLAVGAGLGLVATLALGAAAEPLLFRISARDPAVLLGSVAVLILTGVAANAIPAWRAARVSPVRALAVE